MNMGMLIDFLFPRVCVGCGQKGAYLCQSCKKELYSHPEICPFCHQKSSDFKVCESCASGQILKGIIIGFAYKGVAKKLILKAKFAHKKDVIPFLSKRLALMVQTNNQLKSILNSGQLFISYIPSHRRRQYYEKGYNQSKLLADSLAKQLGIPMLKVASKKMYTVSQLHLNREERKRNLKGVFAVKNLSKIPIGSTVLFVDDVTTTGSTMSELANSIHQQRGDLQLRGIVIARNMG